MLRWRNVFVMIAASWLLVGRPLPVANAQIRAMPITVAGLDSEPVADGFESVEIIDVEFDAFGPPDVAFHAVDLRTWQILPDGLLYATHLAAPKEPRFAVTWVYDKDQGWLFDAALGARVGLIRFGTDDTLQPEGWQFDVEGAAFPRISLRRDRDLVATDYRFGFPLTFRRGAWEGKFAYYHLSSHLADEYMLTFPGTPRINYVRDVFVLGAAFRPMPCLRLYAEAGWAFKVDGGSQPWELQFGADLSPTHPNGPMPSPFMAVGCHLREEVDFGGSLTVQAGWQWRSRSDHLLRMGLHYFNGKSDRYQFLTEHEQHLGLGVWYDY